MKEITSELLDSTYDAIELMNLLAQRLADGEVGCREASSMSWLIGRAKERLDPVIHALEVLESNIEMGADADLIQLGSELLALHEKFRQRRQGLGRCAMKRTTYPNLSRLLVDGSETLREVNETCNHLAELMTRIHGGEWRISVNHDSCFAIVSRNFADRNAVAA